MGKKLNFPIERMHPLRFACHRLSQYYNGYCFLVGSHMNPDKENPRDIDIICVIPDTEFERRYGKLEDWDFETSGYGGVLSERWTLDMSKRSRSFNFLEDTFVDFKVHPLSLFFYMASKYYKTAPGYQIDNRPKVNWETLDIKFLFTYPEIKDF